MIGYYIHHHGSGHLARASEIARQCPEDVVALTSLAEPVGGHPFARWVRLADDPRLSKAVDPRAGGALHWSPLNSDLYRRRMGRLAEWVASSRPRLVVVDVSVEVVTLVRALGIPVVTVAVPGNRDDAPHTLAYQLSSLVIAAWPREVYEPRHLRRLGSKVVYIGAQSRFDDRHDQSPATARTALLLAGSGGGGPTRATLEAMSSATGWRCRGLGGADLPWREDVWSHLCAAEVVVTHAGMAAVAETAAARRPAVIIPEQRPFGEQAATAGALRRAGLATVLDRWPAPEQWPSILADARLRGGAEWKSWNDKGATRRAVDCLMSDLS